MAIVLNRATVVYIIIFLLFCVGIWVVLTLGSVYLLPPPDLSGKWRSMDTNSPLSSFSIRQSGEFIQLTIEQGPQLDLILSGWKADAGNDARTDTGKTLTLAGNGGWNISALPVTSSDSYQFNFQPPASADAKLAGTWRYQRIDRPGRPATVPSVIANSHVSQ